MEHLIAVAAGFLLDYLLGDPNSSIHPVRWMGKMIAALEKRLLPIETEADGKTGITEDREMQTMGTAEQPGGALRDRKREKRDGMLLAFLVIAAFTIGSWVILTLLYRSIPVLGFSLEVFWCYQLLAARCMVKESTSVYRMLRSGRLREARQGLSMIVGRDTEILEEEEVVKACVETVAESTSDGVIAPLLYLLLGGAPLGFFYKAVNTMDSMIGYRNLRYRDFGWFAARLDDVLNWIPARISGFFLCLAAHLGEADGRMAFQMFFRDRKKHASPNAAHTEAAMAGALHLQLGGDTVYGGVVNHKETLGDPLRKAVPEDILQANELLYGTSVLVLFCGLLLGGFLLL